MRTKFNIQNLHITPECISPDYHYSDALSIRLLHSILKNFGTVLLSVRILSVLLSTSKLMEIRGWFQSRYIWCLLLKGIWAIVFLRERRYVWKYTVEVLLLYLFHFQNNGKHINKAKTVSVNKCFFMGSYSTFYFKRKVDQMMSVRHESGFLGCVVRHMLDANREATSDL